MEEPGHQEKQQGSPELVLRSDSFCQSSVDRKLRRGGLTIETQVDTGAMHLGVGKLSTAT